MKIIILFVVIIANLQQIEAQEKLDEGMIKYQITDVKSDNSNNHNSKLSGVEYLIYGKEESFRRDITMMNGRVKYIFIQSPEQKFDTLYMSMGPNKIKVAMKEDPFEGSKVDKSGLTEYPEHTVTVLDQKCYLITIDSSKANLDKSYEIYITQKHNIPDFSFSGFNTDVLRGTPLQISVIDGSSKVTYTATEFSERVDSSVFRINGYGYQNMSMEQFKQNVGGIPGMK